MRTQLMITGAAIALAANKDAGSKNTNKETPENNTQETTTVEASTETEEDAEEKLEPFTIEAVTKKNVEEVAKAVWARIQGEKHSDRADVMQDFVSAIRDARDNDSNKVSRPKKSIEEIINESVDKPMGDLQVAKIPLIGVPINIPTLVRIATSVAKEGEAEHPLKQQAVAFMKQHNLTVVRKKMQGSRGRETTFLVRSGGDNGTIDKLAA